jgi:hypothetical protein
MRPAQYSDEDIVAAGEELRTAGRRVTVFGIQKTLGGGNTARIRQAWDNHLKKERAEPTALPLHLHAHLIDIKNALIEHVNGLIAQVEVGVMQRYIDDLTEKRKRDEAAPEPVPEPVLVSVPTPPPTVVTKAKDGFSPTEEQALIVEDAKQLQPGDVLKVAAFAGSGKTTTLKLIAEAIPGAGCYAAFNRVIQLEASQKMPKRVDCKTMSSIAFGAMGLQVGNITKLNGSYVRDILGDGVWPDDIGIPTSSRAALVAHTIVVYCHSDLPTLNDPGECGGHLADLTNHVLDARLIRRDAPVPENEPKKDREKREMKLLAREELTHEIPRLVRMAWSKIADFRKNSLKIDHDVYLKLFELDDEKVRETFKKYSWIGLDEAQDLNPVMRSIGIKSGRPLIPVGDSFQQIYSWRGAENALDLLPGDRIRYLSQSFRFGEEIAEVARSILDSKPSGGPTVRLRGSDKPSRVVLAEDCRVVICRSNAGVFREAVSSAKAGRRVHVLGGIKKLSDELESAVALYEGRLSDVRSDTLRRYGTWAEMKAEGTLLEDPVLLKLIEAVEGTSLIQDLALLKHHHVTDEGQAGKVVGTTHQAKGKEWPEVRLADDFVGLQKLSARIGGALRRGRPDEAKQVEEEWNVMYVAATRAIDLLSLPPSLYEDFVSGNLAPARGSEKLRRSAVMQLSTKCSKSVVLEHLQRCPKDRSKG